MKITDVKILSKVRVNTKLLINQEATVVGVALGGLISPVIARFCDPVQNFVETAEENITVLTPNGAAYNHIKAKDIEPIEKI
jgi:hypothetical protein